MVSINRSYNLHRANAVKISGGNAHSIFVFDNQRVANECARSGWRYDAQCFGLPTAISFGSPMATIAAIAGNAKILLLWRPAAAFLIAGYRKNTTECQNVEIDR